MRSKLLLTCVQAALATASAASAQSLSPRDGTAWQPIGRTPDFTQYFVDPASLARGEDGLVRIVIRASVSPGPDDAPNTVIARVAVDCAAGTIGPEAADYYREARGFAQSASGMTGAQAAPSDPGQQLVIDHVCTPAS